MAPRYAAEDEAGLVDRSSRPHHSPTPLSAPAEAAIEALRRQRWSGPAIARELDRPVATVGEVLRRLGLGRLSALDPKPPVIRYQREQPGELLHIDVKKLGKIDGVGHRITGVRHGQKRGRGWEFLHVCVDDASRLAYTEILPDERQASAVAFLERALAWFAGLGVTVERVMTDNGSAYRSRSFREACDGAGLKHKRTRPYPARTTDEVEQPFSALGMLFCNRPQATARRRAGWEVKVWPRSLQGRSSFAAPVGARFPRRVHASVCRL